MKRTGIHIKSNGGSMMCCVRYGGSNDVDVYFPRYDYLAEHITYGQFKSGSVKCPYEPTVFGYGYIGQGIYKTRENGKPTREYATWLNMLCRCYNTKFHEKHETYKGCIVCEEWHNFQNFADWYNENSSVDYVNYIWKKHKVLTDKDYDELNDKINKLETLINQLKNN